MDAETRPQLTAALPPFAAVCITELRKPSILTRTARSLKRRVMHLRRPRRRSAGMLRMCESGQAAGYGMVAMQVYKTVVGDDPRGTRQ